MTTTRFALALCIGAISLAACAKQAEFDAVDAPDAPGMEQPRPAGAPGDEGRPRRGGGPKEARKDGGKGALAKDLVAQSAPTWDSNHDGVYTCAEWKEYAARLFRLADRNSDGSLDATEFKSLGQADRMFADADLAYFDDNHDGRVSRSEFVDKPGPFFARYDRNNDCKVTAAELTPPRPEGHPGGKKGGKGGGGMGGGMGGGGMGGF